MEIPDRRSVDVVVISDVHLGTFGCHATELEQYLKSIKPSILVLNGDIIDGWQFSKRYWPKSHHGVLTQIMRLISTGTSVYYLTGNHDEVLRRFSDFSMGDFTLADKLVLKIDGKKAWIFHGDIFDLSVRKGKWLARIGGISYDYLILLNRAVNWALEKFGREKISLSKNIKAGVKKAVKYIGDFEEIAATHAIEQGYDFVICGHIHQPQQRIINKEKGSVLYLNSGDWVENLTALEYNNRNWSIYQHLPETKARVKKLSKKETESEIRHHAEIILTLNTAAP